MQMTLVGVQGVTAALMHLAQQVPAAAAVALNEVAEVTMTASKDRTPVKSGRMKSTGRVADHATPSRLQATLAYGTEYALRQHERLDYRHTVGRAKFLESAVMETDLTAEVAARLKLGALL